MDGQCKWTLHVARGTAYGDSLHEARLTSFSIAIGSLSIQATVMDCSTFDVCFPFLPAAHKGDADCCSGDAVAMLESQKDVRVCMLCADMAASHAEEPAKQTCSSGAV